MTNKPKLWQNDDIVAPKENDEAAKRSKKKQKLTHNSETTVSPFFSRLFRFDIVDNRTESKKWRERRQN